jgi:AbiU2
MTTVMPDQNEDIAIFAGRCVLMRSLYLHARTLFVTSNDDECNRMSCAAPIFFGDLSLMFREHLILQVCKITDPQVDFSNNKNLTVDFLIRHYDFSEDLETMQELTALNERLQAFRKRLKPARNKLISHLDRAAIRSGIVLGGVPENEWDEFWINLQDVVCIIYNKVFGTPFYINGVLTLSDAHGLLKALH